jgi:glycosyltransferase involved in cell wall biosynthesis
MRILVINQFFWPDLAPTGQYLCDLTRHLAANGHEVTVICSGGAYAKADAAGSEPPPVRIIRVPGTRFKRGALSRLFSYSAFFAGVLWHQMRVPRPDIALTMTTPPLLSVAGWILKMLRGSRHFIWEMDLFPDVLVTVGALPENGTVTRILGWISDSARRHSDGVIVLGPCMRARVMARGIPADLVHVAENCRGRSAAPGRCIFSTPGTWGWRTTWIPLPEPYPISATTRGFSLRLRAAAWAGSNWRSSARRKASGMSAFPGMRTKAA